MCAPGEVGLAAPGPMHCWLLGRPSQQLLTAKLPAAWTAPAQAAPASLPLPLRRSCNSVAFAGSIFVRSLEEQQFVRERGPLHVLTATGFPW